MVTGLLGNESSDSNRFTLVTPKSENDVRLQATLGNQNPTGLPVGVVSIQMIGLVGYAYDARNVVKNKRRMFTTLHSIAFIIYLINLSYQLFLNPALRHVNAVSHVNISPLKTIFLYYTAYTRHTLPIKNIILNMIGNVMLFMPFGYFMYVLFKPMRSFMPYFIFFLFLIAGVEGIQYVARVGLADIDDIILNMSGILVLYVILKIPFIKKIF